MKNTSKPTYFIDLDGTLFDQHGITRISYRNQSAILIMQNFANVVFSTGRSYTDIRVQQAMKQLSIDDIICSSGAEVYIDRKLATYINIRDKAVNNIVNYATKRKVVFVVYDSNGEHLYVQNKIQLRLGNLFFKKWMNTISINKDFDIDKHRNITKIAFVLKSSFKTKRIIKEIQELYPDQVNAYAANRNFIVEITDISTNKAIATVEYCKLKGIDLSDAVHIGDSMSDACLKGYVGKLVAMGNATSQLKALADEVAPKHKNGGLYKYFIHHKRK
ncbi:HAD family hydrolase [Mycoplasma sp. ES3157-GEN-MYC]|uniref:HAD hydrolase family protein n=1 Tax=Mycoplasma miroungigenitalium TaxID=754515 RepID=A0A6M4JBR0_9MOLU|nr:HAD hydrolase family protein [Mycoplasma miroungigenitalium]MBU4690571.1 HAD family hydrolase [Mycoplasma miroungigenitalium]MBU4691838.1 HAD family hydrolase [Mycoplasma miroungigenitalium]QJR43698.1 HAD hydrolase family protein [Mycoplasma miroungigenitalium]